MTEVLRETTKLWRKHHLSYDQSRYVVEQVRRALQLSAPRERRRTVARLDKHEVGRLIEAAYRKGSHYGLMVKTLFYTGARVSEFINIRVVDLRFDLDPPQIYLAVAKGGSDGDGPILPALAQELRTCLRARKGALSVREQPPYPLYPTRGAAHGPGRGPARGPGAACYPHRLRASVATLLLDAGMPIDQVTEISAAQTPQHDSALCRDQPEEPGRALPACALMTTPGCSACADGRGWNGPKFGPSRG